MAIKTIIVIKNYSGNAPLQIVQIFGDVAMYFNQNWLFSSKNSAYHQGSEYNNQEKN